MDEAEIKLKRLFARVCSDNPATKALLGLETIAKISTNILADPTNLAKQKLKKTNRLVQNNIRSLKGGEQLMDSLFWFAVIDFEEYFVFPPKSDLNVFKSVVNISSFYIESNLKPKLSKPEKTQQQIHEELVEKLRIQIKDDRDVMKSKKLRKVISSNTLSSGTVRSKLLSSNAVLNSASQRKQHSVTDLTTKKQE